MHTAIQLENGMCREPFEYLGLFSVDHGHVINVWCPYAHSLLILDSYTKQVIGEANESNRGLFSVTLNYLPSEQLIYEVKALTNDGEHHFIDPYQFKQTAYNAVHFIDHAPANLYQQAGAQLVTTEQGFEGVRFAVYAPNASAVSLIGEFNCWNKRTMPMQCTSLGYWVLFVPNISEGTEYKYAICDQYGNQLTDKADPLGFSLHQYPSFASVVYDHDKYQWHDHDWVSRKISNIYQEAMSIYEVHLGSWKRPQNIEQRYSTYRELARDLVAYVCEMGFTHIEVLPISEYPFDGSWGYQPVGLFSPTSRFGDPDDFKYFVDLCHQSSIGVIIDWVPAHFPSDSHGLVKFDGSHLYEYEDPRRGWHPDWDSIIYDFGKGYVRQFLVANALYWFDKFHIDGIRVDAVASMLYLDYSREHDQWVPNIDGGNHNYEAISLLQWMNKEVYAANPNAITIAEESTSYNGVSKPVDLGGLGFGFKWNMGWMHDSLEYINKESIYRKYHHSELSFSMVYAYSENYILPISHDEVVHGKGSMWQKMPGDDWQKMANLRLFYAYMFAHPGKKLQFMGNEFAQYHEWDHDSQLPWELLENDTHKLLQTLFKQLNHVYRTVPALHQLCHEPEGFSWIDLHNHEQSIYVFARFATQKSDVVVVVCNFTPEVYSDYRIGVPQAGDYELLLNSDDTDFGGSGFVQKHSFTSSDIEHHNLTSSIIIDIPPLSALFIRLQQ